jgi:hypothetical protein
LSPRQNLWHLDHTLFSGGHGSLKSSKSIQAVFHTLIAEADQLHDYLAREGAVVSQVGKCRLTRLQGMIDYATQKLLDLPLDSKTRRELWSLHDAAKLKVEQLKGLARE